MNDTCNKEVLVVDDEDDIRDMLKEILIDNNFNPSTASNIIEALNHIRQHKIDLVILDIWLNGKNDGFKLLEIIKNEFSCIPVIIISGHGNTDSAVYAIKLGAYDYVSKPFTAERILLTINRTLKSVLLEQENKELRSGIPIISGLIGNSPEIKQINTVIEKLSKTSSRIMITGASGVGKEIAARIIHKKSPFSKYPFVILHAASIKHKERSKIHDSTGTIQEESITCLLEQANNGTLFIDEVTDLSYESQALLLKIIQEQKFSRSNNKKTKLNVRIISSSARNLYEAIANKTIREDLFYRLNVVPIHIPSLSERSSDIPILSEYFLKELSNKTVTHKKSWGNSTLTIMQSYRWPGNVRQLKNIIEWILIMSTDSQGSIIEIDDLPPDILANITLDQTSRMDLSVPLRKAREHFEKQYITLHLKRFSGNVTRTAEFVGMERSALHRKMKQLSISDEYTEMVSEELKK